MNEDINKDCPCKRACIRHGNCVACREQHVTKMKILPACDRIREKEEKKKKAMEQ